MGEKPGSLWQPALPPSVPRGVRPARRLRTGPDRAARTDAGRVSARAFSQRPPGHRQRLGAPRRDPPFRLGRHRTFPPLHAPGMRGLLVGGWRRLLLSLPRGEVRRRGSSEGGPSAEAPADPPRQDRRTAPPGRTVGADDSPHARPHGGLRIRGPAPPRVPRRGVPDLRDRPPVPGPLRGAGTPEHHLVPGRHRRARAPLRGLPDDPRPRRRRHRRPPRRALRLHRRGAPRVPADERGGPEEHARLLPRARREALRLLELGRGLPAARRPAPPSPRTARPTATTSTREPRRSARRW